MLKAIFVVLLLAGYGLYSLVSGFLPAQERPAKETEQALAEPATEVETLAATREAPSSAAVPSSLVEQLGLEIRELPSQGCTPSILSRERANALLKTLPQSIQPSLYQALELGEPMWTAQLYFGADGTGVCLPLKNKLVMLPTSLPPELRDWDMDSLKRKAAEGAQRLGEAGKSVAKWAKDVNR